MSKWGSEDSDETVEKERRMEDQDFETMDRKPAICRFFSTKRGCIKGVGCAFSHEKPVCAFFNTLKGCRNDQCNFIHDRNAMSNVMLKPCPTSGCSNQCLGKICSDCHKNLGQTQFNYTPSRSYHNRNESLRNESLKNEYTKNETPKRHHSPDDRRRKSSPRRERSRRRNTD